MTTSKVKLNTFGGQNDHFGGQNDHFRGQNDHFESQIDHFQGQNDYFESQIDHFRVKLITEKLLVKANDHVICHLTSNDLQMTGHLSFSHLRSFRSLAITV